jgi:DNA-binding transcriptional regulator YiaG
MPITYAEKNQFIRNSNFIAEELSLKLSNFDNSVLLFKVLAHALRNNENIVQEFNESIFENREAFREKFEVLLQHALNVACTTSVATVEKRKVNEYKPSQLAKYFGVSTMTIHNWLEQKRFVGIEKAGENKHNWIPEDTVFITSSGNKILVSEVVEMWHKQETESTASQRKESDLEYYTRQIAFYEKKYGGEFERTLGAKEKLTSQEETDADIWRHLLGRQKLEFRDKKE